MSNNLQQILQELDDALKFAKNHSFPNIDMEQAFIFGTGLKIQQYLRYHLNDYLECNAIITRRLTEMKLAGTIEEFYWNTEQSGIIIKPNKDTNMSDPIKYTLFPFVYYPKELA